MASTALERSFFIVMKLLSSWTIAFFLFASSCDGIFSALASCSNALISLHITRTT